MNDTTKNLYGKRSSVTLPLSDTSKGMTVTVSTNTSTGKTEDYLLRNALRATFIKRHLDYSNGTKTLKDLPMPNHWKNPVNRRKRKQPSQRKSKTKSMSKSKPQKTAEKDETAEEATVEKVWDSETEEWVPL